MAANTLRPTNTPRRANVPRPVAAPEPEEQAAPPVAEEVLPEPEPTPAPVREKRRREPKAETRPRSSWSIFSLLDRVTSVDTLFQDGLPVRYLPKLLFVMLLTLLYIGNTHYGNRMNRNIQRLKQETEDLRADYTTLKSDYMEASKQSEVARKVAAIGLVESSSPPFRITVPAGHLDAAELELMPVLTADTLAARAARDSAAAIQADMLAGRKRTATESDVDSGPEIIAPPQPLAGDSASAPVVQAAPAHRIAPQNVKAKSSKKAPAKPVAARRKPAATKPNSKPRVQKSTSTHKAKAPAKQPVKAHSR
ncbi:FtsL-like putative cell division protein [Hymenobacter rubidus]|uniref:FtsL-like putative cell division protein n=1 Tax=Hymenobacter rubidus TaxID=1441626 RepID=UPI00191ED2EB|nr:FtsL-like putative cell division protein [Hymenobacter rubidus]